MSERVKLTAVIPVAQYANLQPEIEAEADTYEEALAIAEYRMKDFWNRYVEGDKKLSKAQRLKAFVGGSIDYDAETHTYSWNGQPYVSGSQFAKEGEIPFDVEAASKALGDKFSADPAQIREMWELKGKISRDLGTSIHAAMELYGRFNGLATALAKTTHLHDHPVVKKAVESFYVGREDQQAEHEVLIVDHKSQKAGRIDRLVILGDKVCRVEDYKCNAVMNQKKLNEYWRQLDFYGDILIANGWEVLPPIIHWWNGEWKEISEEGP